MQKRYRKTQDLDDPNVLAFNVVQKSTQEPSKSDISKIMSIMGRKGGSAPKTWKITEEERKENARDAANARWNKR